MDQFDFALSLPFSFAFSAVGAAEASGADGLAPVMRSVTERTASRVLRSLTASSSGAEAGERRIRLSGSGKIRGSSHGPWITNGSSKPDAAVRLATPFMSYSRAG